MYIYLNLVNKNVDISKLLHFSMSRSRKLEYGIVKIIVLIILL